MKRYVVFILVVGLFLTAGCASSSPAPETTICSESTQAAEPAELTGAWVREYVYVDGDQQYDDGAVCTAQIVCRGDSYYITYESEEMPARNLTDTPITILSDGGDYWLSDCPWFGRIEQSDGSMTRFVAILEDGGLMIQNQWTQDGASSAGYESFRRAN